MTFSFIPSLPAWAIRIAKGFMPQDKNAKAKKAARRTCGSGSLARRKALPTPPHRLRAFAATLPAGRSTSANRLTAVRSLLLFLGKENADIPLSSITATMMHRYVSALTGRGVCRNTAACYLRSLRAVYNAAVRAGIITDTKPFRDCFTGNAVTTKRAITSADIRRLSQPALPEGSFLRLSQDIFLFSFYAQGIPLVDLAHLRTSHIRKGMLVYCRRKTGREVRVRLEPCMRQILQRYASPSSPYLFPILERGDYSSFLSYYNRSLKQLAKMAGVSSTLTSYVPRHSWASIAYARDVPLPVIAKAMGHADTQTTLTYLAEINDKRVERANRKVLREIVAPIVERWNKIHLKSHAKLILIIYICQTFF